MVQQCQAEAQGLVKKELPTKVVNRVQYGSFTCNVNENEEAPLHHTTAKYWYRWYICLMMSMLGLLQGLVWNTWSPIDESAECALGFTQKDIDLMTNWGAIALMITLPVFLWMLNSKGLRMPVLFSAFLTSVGAGLRCLPLPVEVLKYFVHAGQILNGAAGCTVMANPPLLSNVWFPLAERVTATSILISFSYAGSGLAFVAGPLMVTQPSKNGTHNKTTGVVDFALCNHTDEKLIIRREIKNLMYLEFGACLVILLGILSFFPNKPPLPPSASASATRLDFKRGLESLRHNRTFLVLTLTFSITAGAFGGWMGVFSVILSPLGVSQDEAGKLGFMMTFVGCIVGVIFGWIADRCKGHLKSIIAALLVLCFSAYLYYIAMSSGWIKLVGINYSDVQLWTVCIIIGIIMNAVVPLWMEMAADVAYPTSEAISSGVVIFCYNLLTFLLLLVLQFTYPAFTNYLMLILIGLSVPLLLIFTNEQNNRVALDMHDEALESEPSMVHGKPSALDANINPELSSSSHPLSY